MNSERLKKTFFFCLFLFFVFIVMLLWFHPQGSRSAAVKAFAWLLFAANIYQAQARAYIGSRDDLCGYHVVEQSVLPLRSHIAEEDVCLCVKVWGPPSIQFCPPVCNVIDIWPETGRPWGRGGWPSGLSAGPRGRQHDSPAHWWEGLLSLHRWGQAFRC